MPAVLIISLLMTASIVFGSPMLVVPHVGQLDDMEDACCPTWHRSPEGLFVRPWFILGPDWILKEGLGRSWSIQANGEILVVLPADGPELEYAEDTTVCGIQWRPISQHVVALQGHHGWKKLLSAPGFKASDGSIVGRGDYAVQYWVPTQQALLTRVVSGPGPGAIMVLACTSRDDAVDRFLAGEIDLLDDLSFEERTRLAASSRDFRLIARRSNSLVYLMWNTHSLTAVSAEARRVLAGAIDRRRLASRVGSRPSWQTVCPLPPDVPGSWDMIESEVRQDTTVVLPDSITIVHDGSEIALQACKEIKYDFDFVGVRTGFFPDTNDTLTWKPYIPGLEAFVGIWKCVPDSILPPHPPEWKDPLPISRSCATIAAPPTPPSMRVFADELKSALELEGSLVCLCWLSRWGAVTSAWRFPPKGSGPLTTALEEWRYREKRR